MIKKTAKDLNEALKNLDEAKEYFTLKKQISENDYIVNLLELIKQEQKEANEALLNNEIEKYKIKKATLKVLEDKFASHPLIANYIVAKGDMEQILEQIVSILSDN